MTKLPFSGPIVGARFRPPAGDVLNCLPGDEDILLIRQPDNQYDANAVQVCITPDQLSVALTMLGYAESNRETVELEPHGNYHIGFIPKEKAALVAPYLDNLGGQVSGKLTFNAEGRPWAEFEVEDEPEAA